MIRVWKFCSSTPRTIVSESGRVLCRKGKLHRARGELDDALRVLDDSITLKIKIGESSADLASALYFVGDIYAERKQRPEAITNFDKALCAMKENSDEVDRTDVYLTMGRLCELHDDIDGCLEAFGTALDEIRAFPRMGMDRAAFDLRTIARVYACHGDSVGALPIFQESLTLTQDRPGSLERAYTLFDMGSCGLQRGEFEGAAIYFKQSLVIRKEKLGAGEELIQTLEKLGMAHKLMGQNDEALLFCNEALDMTEITYGEDNEKVAEALYALGDLKESMGDHVEALANFGECLEVRRRHLDQRCIEIADTLERIGSIHCMQSSYQKAYHCYAEALDVRQAISEPDDPVLGDSFHCIGVVARKRGDFDRALHFLLDALHIRKEREQPRQMCETLFEIGHVHRYLMDPESALECFEKCLDLLHQHYGETDKMVGDVLLSLGHVHRYFGKTEKALECYEEGNYRCIQIDLLFLHPRLTLHYSRQLSPSFEDEILLTRPHKDGSRRLEFGTGQI